MKRSLSLYLDCVRFIAACLVVFSHFVDRPVFPHEFREHAPLVGRLAVIIFFVLSGFVIAYTQGAKRHDLRQYVVARSARIYSVALPVLCLAFVLTPLLEQWTGILSENHYQFHRFYIYLPVHLLFGGQLWTLEEVPPDLVPYWSLDYEVWYYVLFAAFAFTSGWRRYVATALVLLVTGYKIWLLLPIWVAGVVLYQTHEQVALSRTHARLGWALSVLALIVYCATGCNELLRDFGRNIWPFPHLALTTADRYVADYVVMVIIVVNFYCATHAGFEFSETWARRIRRVSSYTFTLYLLHALIIEYWVMLHPGSEGGWLTTALLTVLIAASTWGLGQLTEHRKDWFAQFFSRLLGVKTTAPRRSGENA